MREGIYIPAGVVRVATLLMLAAVGYLGYVQYPEARRYLKIEAM